MPDRKPILLVRHAQAEHHIRNITGGWSDTGLTSAGFQQSSRLSSRLVKIMGGRSMHLGASNLRRARQTAGIIAQNLSLDLHIHPELSDLNNGLAANLTHLQASELAVPPGESLLDWQPYPQAETWRQFFTRVSGFMREFTSEQQIPALLVTHAANIQVIVAWWLGFGVDSRAQFEAAPASLTLLRENHFGEPTLERLNDTAHLHAEFIQDDFAI